MDKIHPAEWQPRKEFDNESLNELKQSLKEKGVIQPIVVRICENDYQIIAGERRFRAWEMLGNETIPAIIKDVDDFEAKEISIIENWQRQDLTGREKEEFIYGLWMEGSTGDNAKYKKQIDMSRKTGISRTTINRIILAVEERNSISNIPRGTNIQKNFSESSANDLDVTRALIDDVETRADVLQIKIDKKINRDDARQVSKALVAAPEGTRQEIVKLIDEEKLKPKDVESFVKSINFVTKESHEYIIDLVKEGHLEFEQIEELVKIINISLDGIKIIKKINQSDLCFIFKTIVVAPQELRNKIIDLISTKQLKVPNTESFIKSINIAPKKLYNDIIDLIKNEHIRAEEIEELVRIINIAPDELYGDIILAFKDKRIKLEEAEKFIHNEVEVLKKLREEKSNWLDVEEVAKIADAMKAKQRASNIRTQQVENVKENKLDETTDSKSEKVDSSKHLINTYNEALRIIIPNFNLERMNNDKKYRNECIPFVQKFTKYFEDLMNE